MPAPTSEDEASDRDPPTMGRFQFWILMASTLGLFIGTSLWRLGRGAALGATMSTSRLAALLAVEVILGLAWSIRLKAQGWRLRAITTPFGLIDMGVGVLLFAIAWVAYYLTFILTYAVAPAFAASARAVSINGHPNPLVALAVCAVNPIAEEFLYLGVLAASLRRQDVLLAFSAAVVARVAVHLYQGPLGIISVTPIAVVFTGYYLAKRRIWPVVTAHAIMDVLAFSTLVMSAA